VTASTVTTTLRLGTRASELARTQSQAVADAITAATGAPVELVPIVTEGDRSSAAIAQLGGTGVFVTALRGSPRR
jgi:hydroxymethylbilane synthase